ncbi:hypothetical protein FMH13_13660 [Vibrio cholerae]|nr:hypothetical protein [Vibrio cholerae]
MKNRLAKQMICSVEEYRRNGCVPSEYRFAFEKGDFGYWVHLKSGWFFRAVYHGRVSLASHQLNKI